MRRKHFHLDFFQAQILTLEMKKMQFSGQKIVFWGSLEKLLTYGLKFLFKRQSKTF